MKQNRLFLRVCLFCFVLLSGANLAAQNITKNFNQTPLSTVLKEVETQTGLSVIYEKGDVNGDKPITASFNNASVTTVLKQVLDPSLDYTVSDKMIVIHKKQAAPAAATSSRTSSKVTGVVRDASGVPIIGATVLVDGTSTGTATGVDGTFSINAKPENTLVFSFMGYVSQKLAVGSRTSFDVTLAEDSQAIEEVVVIGYGTSTVNDLTSATASVKADKLDKGAQASIDNMLQGRIAGLNMSSNSAQPGAGLSVNIRGSISPNGNNEPLYVIDGVPMTSNSANVASISGGNVINMGDNISQSPLNTINPSDIQSIDVLKDASAAAIYGSASANGVIIITTKRGAESKPTLSYNGSYTLQVQKPYAHELLNGEEFMLQRNLWYKENLAYLSNTYPYGQVDYNGDGVVDMNDYTAITSVPDIFSAAEISAIGEGFNWLDYVTDNAYVTEHNFSLNGGNSNTKYFVSYNYYKNDGLLKLSDMSRHTMRLNLDQTINKWLKAGVSINYANISNNFQGSNYGNVGQGHYNILECAYRMTPTIGAVIDPTTGAYMKGYDSKMASPQGYLDMTDKSKNKRITINPTLDVNIMDGLTFKVVGGYDNQVSTRNRFIPSTSGMYLAEKGLGMVGGQDMENKSLEGYFNYNKTFGDHRLSAVLGFGGYQTNASYYVMQAADFFTDSFGTDNMSLGTNLDKKFVHTGKSEITKLSQFGRINYVFKDRYILSLTGRRDGSSVFAANKKWGFFPSVSGAWRISEEEFMDWSDNWLSNFKLRLGYGTSGNEPMRANSLSIYRTGTNIITAGGYNSGVILQSLGNPDLSWETNETINAGLDFGLFDQRLTGSVDYFVRTAKDLLDYKSLPSNNPVTSVISNIGSTQARGWEFTLSSRNIENSNFSWYTDFNISYTLYRWKERNPELVLNEWVPEDAEMSAIYGWKTDGIFHSYEEINAYTNANGDLLQPKAVPGNVRYVDANGDGVLDDKDNVFLGRSTAPIRFGLNNTLSYKNLTLSFYFYGVAGNKKSIGDVGSASDMSVEATLNTYNTVSRRWSVQNPDGDWPGLGNDLTSTTQRSGGSSDFWLASGAFAKLKNVTLSYALPEKWINAMGIGSMALSVDMQNLATFTNYYGFDPELNGQFPYPQAYSFNFGVKVTF